MSATPPQPDVSASPVPAPTPTHPVAGRPVTAEAPEFDWIPVPEADAYRLQLAATDAFETLYHDQTVDGPTALTLADVLPEDAAVVWWRVRAETERDSTWSAPAHFDASPPAPADDDRSFLVDAPPVLLHPVEGDSVEPRAAAFNWESVPEAGGYQLQVSPSDAFEAPTIDLTLDQTTSVTVPDALSEKATSLHWRVRALFPNDTEGPWSEPARFRTEPEDPPDTDMAPQGEVDPPGTRSPSPKRSAVAAGPAREAHTSNTMALTFVAVLVVSFLLTILAVLLV